VNEYHHPKISIWTENSRVVRIIIIKIIHMSIFLPVNVMLMTFVLKCLCPSVHVNGGIYNLILEVYETHDLSRHSDDIMEIQ